MRTLDVFYIVAIYFLVLAVVSKDNRIYAAILFLFSAFNVLAFDFFGFTGGFDFYDKKEFLIKLDGALALIMTIIMSRESRARNQAIIITFMVSCHTMILLHFITDCYFMWAISKPFYILYDELIIISALLQMWVSRDGMVKGLNNAFYHIQGCLFRFGFYIGHNFKHLLTRKKRES